MWEITEKMAALDSLIAQASASSRLSEEEKQKRLKELRAARNRAQHMKAIFPG